MTARRVGRLGPSTCALLAALALTGCDSWVFVLIENGTDSVLRIELLDTSWDDDVLVAAALQPGQVVEEGDDVGPFRIDRPRRLGVLTATDRNGVVVYSQELVVTPERDDCCRVVITRDAPASEPALCTLPVATPFPTSAG